MYRYYARSAKSDWKIIADKAGLITQLRKEGVPFISALAISHDLDKEEPEDGNPKYRGDFYLDIDRPSIAEAIEDAQAVLELLIAKYEYPNPEIYCTGSKGFHFIIPATATGTTRARTHLPWVYREFAAELAKDSEADGIDFVVYSEGKGRLWREPNIQRENGKYKVPITPDELQRMTPERYAEYISAPRHLTFKAGKELNPALASALSAASDRVQKALKSMSKLSGIPKKQMKTFSFESGCIQRLIKFGAEKEGANFNRAAMVMASFIKDKGYKESEYMPYLEKMAKHTKSSTYKTRSLRLKHLKAAVHTAYNNAKIRFARAYLYSVIHACRECDICLSRDGAGSSESDAIEELGKALDRSGIFVRPHAYVKGRDEEGRELTNFTMRINKIYMKEDPDLHQFFREKADITLIHPEGESNIVLFDDAFLAKASFGRAISGVSNLVFKGNELDLLALKEYIFSHAEEAQVVYTVNKYGLNVVKSEYSDKEFLVYVEPGYSISMTGVINEYQVATADTAVPRLGQALQPATDTRDFVDQTMKNLLKINTPQVLAPILGWFLAAFYKVHFGVKYSNQFPLLHVYGNAGSGKTATAELMSYIHGLDYAGQDSVLNLSSSSIYAIKHTMASTTTVPRVFDELNRNKVAKFDQVCELLKQCWTSQASVQGTVSKSHLGSHTGLKQLTLTAPICTLGEQQLETPALNERIVQVHMSPHGRVGVEARDSFTKVNTFKQYLTAFGRLIMLESLKTPAINVAQIVDEVFDQLPKTLTDRPRLGRAIIVAGLELGAQVAEKHQLSVHKDLRELKNGWLRELMDATVEEVAEMFASEVDRVLDFMAKMVSYEDDPPHGSLRRDYEFMVAQGRLYLDVNKALMLYRRQARSVGLEPVFTTARHMRKHLVDEPYFIEFSHQTSATGQHVEYAVLSIPQLLAKGVSAAYFLSEDDDVRMLRSSG